MKTKKTAISLTKEMIDEFEVVFGKQYTFPPTLPMIFYRYMEVAWEPSSPPILRDQHCACTKELVVGETYLCQVELDNLKQMHGCFFYTQSLFVYDKQGEVCCRCVSKLVTHSPLRKKT